MNRDGEVAPEPADPEYRRDPVTGQWVMLASERSRRPIQESMATAESIDILACPFCEGREEQTPPETLALRNGGAADGGGWTVRVVPNRYPAARMGLRDTLPDRHKSRLARTCAGLGKHEVVIERPDHHWTTSDLSDRHVADVFDVYRQRLRFFRTKRPLRYGMVFKNVGPSAGASQDHAHSQILAITDVPPRIQDEITGSEQYYQSQARCVFCDLIEWEKSEGERAVEETDSFFVWCPYASRFPYELWLIPKAHASRYEEIQPGAIEELGGLVRRLLGKLEAFATPVAYNYYIHTAPFAAGCDSHYHWHLEIAPRLTGLAGFELGSGMHINTVPPEWAARQWRDAKT